MILMNCNPVGCFSPLGYFRFYRGANDFVSHALDFFFFNPWWDSLLTCISPSLFKAVSSSFFFFFCLPQDPSGFPLLSVLSL